MSTKKRTPPPIAEQVSILLPASLVDLARTTARREGRGTDGMKVTYTAILRRWLLRGAEGKNV